MDRLSQADDLILKAVEQIEKDPYGSLSIMRASALAGIATALILREIQNDNDPPW